MPRHKVTEDELEILTPEEREGILEDTEDGEVDPALAAETAEAVAAADGEAEARAKVAEAAKTADGKVPAVTETKTTEPGKVELVEGSPEAIAAAAEAAKVVDEVKPAAKVSSAVPRWEAPADADDKLKAIATRQDDLAQKFDDGELTAKEFRTQTRELDAEERDIREQLLKASMSQEMTVDNWTNSTVPAFLAQHAEYEVGSPLYNALDVEVRKLQATDGGNPFDPAILEQAHNTVNAAMRKAFGIKDDPANDPKDGKDPKVDTTPRPLIPPTLARVPAADTTGTTDGGEFAALDRLADKNPLEYEKALARMQPADRDRYLAAG